MSTRRSFLIKSAAAVAAAAATRTVQSAYDPPPSLTAVANVHTDMPSPEPSGKVVRLAIVGTGQISHRYLKQAAGSKRAQFVATCARTIKSAKARAVEYGINAWFDDYIKMYDEIAPDAVVIAAPTAVHAGAAIAAFDRGIHVLCEKPMAVSLKDCHAMVDAAKRAGVIFLNLPYDASPPFLAALAYLNESTLGVFTGAEAQVLLPGVSRDNWYFDREIAGGGAGLDTLVYPVSRLISMLGPAQRVTGFVNTLIPRRILGDGRTIDTVPPPRNAAQGKVVEPTVDDNATLIIEWSNGQQAVVRALWGTSIVRNDSAIYGRHGTLWLSGNDVVIHSPERVIPGATEVSWGSYKSCYRVPVTVMKDIQNEGLVDHFVDCIEGTSQPTCGGQQLLHVHEILFRGYEAACTGQSQRLETSFEPWHGIDRALLDTRSAPI